MSDIRGTQQFDTWSEIAEYLGVSVREAQYREKNDGLPVRRMAGKKPRVWALRSELDAWRLNAGSTAIVPSPNPATDQPQANLVHPRSVEENDAPTARWGRRAVLSAAGLAVVGVGAKLILGARKPRVERAVLTGNLLSALDGLGNPIWAHRFPGNIEEPIAADLRWRVQVVDLEGSGSPGVLAVYSRAAQAFPARTGVSDELQYFTSDGQMKWNIPCRANLLDPDGKQFEPAWVCSRVIAVPSGKHQTLWAAIHHGWRWPGYVMRVDANGAASVRLANAGFVETLCRVTGPDGEFIAVAGENNAFERSFAAVLNANDPASCSPEGGAARCHFANAPSGTPRHYVLFPTTEMLAAQDSPYGHVLGLHPTNDGGFVVWVAAGGANMAVLLYEFSATGEPRSVMPSGSFPAVHRRFEEEGKLHHSWAECPELHRPLTIRHWRRGSAWQDQEVPWRDVSDRG